MKGWGIRARVLVLALAPSVLILLALVGFFTYERIQEVDRSLAERGRLLARGLAPEAEFAIFAGDHATLQRLVDAAAHEVDVRGIRVDDALGRELVRGGDPGATTLEGDHMRYSLAIMQTRLAVSDFPEDAPSDRPPTKVGEVTVVMSRDQVRSQQGRLLQTGLLLGLGGLAIAITLALAIGNGVIRPIRRLAQAIVALGQGHRVAPVPTSGGGELGTLSAGFNQMAERLQAGARELEGRVDEATRALQLQKDTAERATQAKSRFIAAASHDLRQPLHAIGLFTSTLQRRTSGTELEPVASHLGKAVAAMDRLFGSLFDMSRLEAGTLHAEPRSFPMQRLLDQLEAEYADAAEQKHLRLCLQPTGAIVHSDEMMLHRILSNLVANAIRYTRQGGVMVCCRPRGARLLVQVRDSGAGIASDKQQAIFEEFYQVNDGSMQRDAGLGLGLAIVSRLARLLSTQVLVRSSPGRGSTFSLVLPRGVEEAATATVGIAEQADPGSGPKLRVLVIDDDPLVLAGTGALLEEMGCAVTAISDASQAQAELARHAGHPVLVLCDMWLGDGVNGVELLQRLSAAGDPPISGILISGDTRPGTLATATNAGIPLVHKPVSPAKLRAIVASFAASTRRRASSGEAR